MYLCFPVAQIVNNPAAMQVTRVQSLGWEVKQKLTELKGETDKYTITVEDLNIPQYSIENIGRQSVRI